LTAAFWKAGSDVPPYRLAAVLLTARGIVATTTRAADSKPSPQFHTSDRHRVPNGLRTASGQDVSIGFDWRASMMANSSRDPLAGRCPPRDDRPSESRGRDRRRMLGVPHADRAL
jgi:hypothetical protein